MAHSKFHEKGIWYLLDVNGKALEEPYEFTFGKEDISFSYGNGYYIHYEIHHDKIKWGHPLKTELKNPTPHTPPEQEVVDTLLSTVRFDEEHHNLHFYNADNKQVMVFTHQKPGAK